MRVGNSIKLTLTVRGQGNLEFLRLPELDVLPGLHKLGQAEAKRDADRVVVTYDLTPTSADVREVPAIDWNYFDTTPGVERFVTVQTRASPLQVQALAAGETLAPVAEGAAKAVMPGVDDVFDLPPLVGPPVVVVTRPGWLALLLVAAPWLLVLLAVLVWRGSARRRSDVLGGRARGAAKACLAALQQGGDPLVALTTYLGDRLGVPAAAVIAADAAARLQAAGIDSEATAAVVAAIERGTAARYGGGAQLDADTVRRCAAARTAALRGRAVAAVAAAAVDGRRVRGAGARAAGRGRRRRLPPIAPATMLPRRPRSPAPMRRPGTGGCNARAATALCGRPRRICRARCGPTSRLGSACRATRNCSPICASCATGWN